MRKILSFILISVILLSAMPILSSAENGEKIYEGYLFVLSKVEKSPENGMIFGVEAKGVIYPEYVSGVNMSDDRCFIKIALPVGTDTAAALETVLKNEDVIDAWYLTVAENGDEKFIKGCVMATHKGIPELKNADENGFYEVFGVKCKAVEYDRYIRNGKNNPAAPLILIYLPNGADEAEAINILKKNENITAASLDYIIKIDDPDYIVGDINGDGNINAKDYSLLKRHILGTYVSTEAELENADTNGDGKVDAKDYALIKRHVLGTYNLLAR